MHMCLIPMHSTHVSSSQQQMLIASIPGYANAAFHFICDRVPVPCRIAKRLQQDEIRLQCCLQPHKTHIRHC
jgi:hypothetical protein